MKESLQALRCGVMVLATLTAWEFQITLGGNNVEIESLRLRDTSGNRIDIPDSRFIGFVFLGTECPLAKLYGPRIERITENFDAKQIGWIGVNSNVQDSPSEIDQYARQHDIGFPIAKDSDQSVADAFGASRTPEVFVLDQSGRVQYRGRIDDQYEPGIARGAPTKNDLRDALNALVNHRPVPIPVTKGVGCLITRIDRTNRASMANKSAGTDPVTFNDDIARLLNQHCVECHRQGEIAPFSLTDYEEVIGWADMILEVIDQKRMPPWHADPNIGAFQGARVLPREARGLIARWIEDGFLEGNRAAKPEPPSFRSGWHLMEKPDVEILMRNKPFVVPANGIVEYQYFVVDPGWHDDRWVSAAQVIPGDAAVVHHTIVFVRPPDGADSPGLGWLGAYVPGQRTIQLPTGHARRIPAGSKLVFQMHYTPNGNETEDQSKLGIWFADPDSVKHQVTTHIAINHQFEIPPGTPNHLVTLSSQTFPQHGRMLGITPHMHFRGKSFRLFAVPITEKGQDPADRREWLRVPQYDFNWQHWYAFKKSKDLAGVGSLQMEVAFDNSTRNPSNPDPKEFVTWGDQSWEEMAVAFYDVATEVGRPLQRRSQDLHRTPEELSRQKAKAEVRIREFFRDMDQDANGVVTAEETPETFRRFGFQQFDRNQDGQITRSELLDSGYLDE